MNNARKTRAGFISRGVGTNLESSGILSSFQYNNSKFCTVKVSDQRVRFKVDEVELTSVDS
jgi:hypothetical protein